MAVDASPERPPNALTGVLTRAGAVFAWRGGRPVAVSFGSAAGELAACVSAAGMADSSQLTKLELCGPRAGLADLVRAETGAMVASGGLLHAAGAWWCGAAGAWWRGAADAWWCGAAGHGCRPAERVIVLCEPPRGPLLRKLLGAAAARVPGVAIRDRSDEWAAITILGAATAGVLDELGVFGPSGDPHQVPPFHYAPLGEIAATWLLQSAHRALVLVRSADADVAWHAIERGGRRQYICCVGHDAMARYALLERRAL